MQTDVTELIDFYARPLGGVVRRILAARIRTRWRHVNGATLMGLGFATPYLGSFRGEALRLGALMPAMQGAIVWPPAGAVHSVVVEEDQLPLPDNSVDYMLAIHCLEASEQVRPLLREIWRVMKPEGRLLIVVPNRRSIWARLERTPFGHGRPFTTSQLDRLLADALFTPLAWSAALYMPPIERPLVMRSAMSIERFGSRLSSAFAGVIIVEAQKELMSPAGTGATARRLREYVPNRGTTRAPAARGHHDDVT